MQFSHASLRPRFICPPRRLAARPFQPAMETTVGPLSKVYNSLIGTVDKYVPQKLRPLWMHPAGPKTVFFWGPLFKWGVVIAGISDLMRPADSIAVRQCATLGATGIIWARWSLVIIPKNYTLFAANIFVALSQFIIVGRALMYQQEQKKLQDTNSQAAK